MTQPGYQAGSEPLWWWKVALHLDEAQLALANAMAHNLDDQRPVFAIQDRLREGQAILLEIFRMKGLLPGAPNGTTAVPMPPMPGVPMPPMPPMPGVPMPMPMPTAGMPLPFVPAPMVDGDVAVAPAPAPAEQAPPRVAEEPVVVASAPATITSPVPTTAAPSADSGAGGPAGR